MKSSILATIVGLVAAIGAAGCATMVNGTTQDVYITSLPAGAAAHIEPGGETLTTPATVALKRKNSYTVSFEHDGYEDKNAYLDREGSGAVWGNILLGGIIGLIVDYSSGGAYKLAPDPLHVDLQTAAAPAASPLAPPDEAPAEGAPANAPSGEESDASGSAVVDEAAAAP